MVDKKKLNRKDFIFEKKNGETLVKTPGQIFGQQFVVMNLTNCKVYLMDHIADIFVDDSTDCEIFVGPVAATLFIRDCKNVKISGAAKQVRMSDCSNIDANIYSNTEPAFENCKDIRVAPYNFWYPHQTEHFQQSGLDPTADKWSQVFDFNHVPNQPNWKLLPPEEYAGPHKKEVEEDPSEPENPVAIPRAYGGTSDVEIVVGSPEQQQSGPKQDGGLVEFDIKTGQQQALDFIEKQELQQEQQHQEQPSPQKSNSPVKEQKNDFDDFFGGGGDQHHQQQQEQPVQQKSNSPVKEQKNDFDDYFGGGEEQHHQQHQQSPGLNASNQGGFNTNFDSGFQQGFDQGGAQHGFGQQGFGQQGFGQQGFGQQSNIDPEEEERLMRLKKIEDERIRTLQQKMQKERDDKDERRMKANQDLNKWASDRMGTNKKRKELNKQIQQDRAESKNTNQHKNPWEKIVSNIDLKVSDYKGSKDVTRFKDALVNKRSDMQNIGGF